MSATDTAPINATSERLAHLAADAALDLRARNVTLLDLREMNTFTDFFVICTGTSDTHIEGIVGRVMERMKEAGETLLHREGHRRANWILLDYVDVIVHVFSRESRAFYGLERLWGDATRVDLGDDDTIDADATIVETPSLTRFSALDDADEDEDEDDDAVDWDEVDELDDDWDEDE
ncbi:MAG: ribosome silencing factor [Candidatus Poribacteria bacterium]|nr:ribosome silencing factor [Candidatus Poribacteria bacterium]